MGDQTERELMLPGHLTHPSKQSCGARKLASVKDSKTLQKPVIDLKASLTRGDASDHRAQTRMV